MFARARSGSLALLPLLWACTTAPPGEQSPSETGAGAPGNAGQPSTTAGAGPTTTAPGGAAGDTGAAGAAEPALSGSFDDQPSTPTTVTTDGDVIVTHVADRGRRRHEPSCLSQALGAGPDTCDFDNYHFMYWTHDARTLDWQIRDGIAAGASELEIEVDMRSPHAQDGANAQQNVPNLRCFARYGTVTDFYQNYAMQPLSADAASATRFRQVIGSFSDSNDGGASRPLRAGDLLECELTVRWRELVERGFQANYYSRRVRYVVGRGGFWGFNQDVNVGPIALLESNLLGGRTTDTVRAPGERGRSFMQFVMNGSQDELQTFLDGRRLFRTSFIDGTHDDPTGTHDPAAAQPVLDAAALGATPPIAEARARCSGCHVNDGNGPRFPAAKRAAPALIGVGLLEAIDVADLLENERKQRADASSPIRGELSRQLRDGRLFAGRFGWDATAISVREQVSRALENEMGVDSASLPAGMLEQLTTYVRLLAVPAPRSSDLWSMPGSGSFVSFGCSACHLTRSYVTGRHELQALRAQTIVPLSDLLLHELGQGEPMRTTPLWGVGLKELARGEPRYWHDDSVTSLTEAIERHQGEAERARSRFADASVTERDQLLEFLAAL